MTESPHSPVTSLPDVVDRLVEEARTADHGLRVEAVVDQHLQHAVVFALRAGSELPEHEPPPAACLQVLRGEVVLVAGEERHPLAVGDLRVIPRTRHKVEAVTDAACLLTVTVDAAG
ncbi:cupin domain-containing protein [Ornithinimicrobium sediminis]|uniref:cupin domain-containing protein n=1 Tax=Ornithinimicrobium sediminis TaxID=2904603 RepID=UPI001E41C370|nr:cupin domain-containing protein [Ornithinimicrobium sediminis]MCE0487136.1 LuxR family transcriptional regulator [Ornithinimicrobium sediminis]